MIYPRIAGFFAALATFGAAVLETGTVSAQACPGDLNRDGNVSVSELVTAVKSALDGCASNSPRFVDNGNGTITDRQMGLMWEKKVGDPKLEQDLDDLHSASARYPVSGYCLSPEGSRHGCSQEDSCPFESPCILPDAAILNATDWLDEVNRTRFAGYSDWRLPTLQELMSLFEYGTSPHRGPAVDETFHSELCEFSGCTDATAPSCSCTEHDYYLSSTVSEDDLPTEGMVFDFSDGTIQHHDRAHVRAVRSISD